VYDARGRFVANLVSKDFEPGYHSVVWHGRDASGQPVASGVYLASMRAQGFSQIHKMLLVK
jgi:flagellar hook assembly protein FlgD